MHCGCQPAAFLQPPQVLAQWVCEPWLQGWRLCMGSTAWTSIFPALSSTSAGIYLMCQLQGLTPSPQYGTIPCGDWPPTWCQADYHLLLWRGQRTVLRGIDIYSGYGFAFPARNLPWPTPASRDSECLITTMALHTVLHLIKELFSQ